MCLESWCIDKLRSALFAVEHFHCFDEHEGDFVDCTISACSTTRERLTTALADNPDSYHALDVSATLGHLPTESSSERNTMVSVPPPPPITGEVREIHPVQMFYGKESNFTDFGPHVLPANAEVEPKAPKGAGATFMSSEEALRIGTEPEPSESQGTLPLEPPESETESTSQTDLPSTAATAGTPSQPSSSPTGSSPTSTGKPVAPVPVPNTR